MARSTMAVETPAMSSPMRAIRGTSSVNRFMTCVLPPACPAWPVGVTFLRRRVFSHRSVRSWKRIGLETAAISQYLTGDVARVSWRCDGRRRANGSKVDGRCVRREDAAEGAGARQADAKRQLVGPAPGAGRVWRVLERANNLGQEIRRDEGEERLDDGERNHCIGRGESETEATRVSLPAWLSSAQKEKGGVHSQTRMLRQLTVQSSPSSRVQARSSGGEPAAVGCRSRASMRTTGCCAATARARMAKGRTGRW